MLIMVFCEQCNNSCELHKDKDGKCTPCGNYFFIEKKDGSELKQIMYECSCNDDTYFLSCICNDETSDGLY